MSCSRERCLVVILAGMAKSKNIVVELLPDDAIGRAERYCKWLYRFQTGDKNLASYYKQEALAVQVDILNSNDMTKTDLHKCLFKLFGGDPLH